MTMLDTLIRYNAWANRAFLEKIEKVDPSLHPEDVDQMLRLMDHIFVVGDIFASRLVGKTPVHLSDTRTITPAFNDLRAEMIQLDSWYLEYVRDLAPETLSEKISFRFTDGDAGCMSREEILTHVVLHGGYHRGEIGRLLKRIGAEMPWDTFAVFLHADEPKRRHV